MTFSHIKNVYLPFSAPFMNISVFFGGGGGGGVLNLDIFPSKCLGDVWFVSSVTPTLFFALY